MNVTLILLRRRAAVLAPRRVRQRHAVDGPRGGGGRPPTHYLFVRRICQVGARRRQHGTTHMTNALPRSEGTLPHCTPYVSYLPSGVVCGLQAELLRVYTFSNTIHRTVRTCTRGSRPPCRALDLAGSGTWLQLPSPGAHGAGMVTSQWGRRAQGAGAARTAASTKRHTVCPSCSPHTTSPDV